MTSLLPTQQRWLRSEFTDWHHFNLAWLGAVPADLTRERLHHAVQQVLDRQPALRTAYRESGAGRRSETLELSADTVIRQPELTDYRGQGEALSAEIAQAQRTLRPDLGEVFRVIHFPYGDEPGRLLLCMHHLTLDGYSVGLVATELERALQGRPGPLSATPEEYVKAVEEWVGTPEAEADLRQWLARPWDRVGQPPTDLAGDTTLPTMRVAGTQLDTEQTRALTVACRGHRLRPADVLLDALAQTVMGRWSLDAVAVDTYHMGRHLTPLDIDVIDTVGYLQNTFPVVIGLRGDFDPTDLRSVPERMFGFDALRHFTDRLTGVPDTTLRFNFRGQLGRLDQRPGELLRLTDEPVGQTRSQRQTERYTLMAEGDLVEGRLMLHIKHSTGQYRPETIAQLLDGALDRVLATTRKLAGMEGAVA